MAGYYAKKRLGQHFLKSAAVIRRITELVTSGPRLPIIEIGPGRGALTLPLAETGARLAAVEFDRDLIGHLNKMSAPYPNLEIINADFLSFEPDAEEFPAFTLVGNIAYNITSPVLDWCSRYGERISKAVLMVQREMANRITASPGCRDWSPMALFTQLSFRTERCFEVSADSFMPKPKVTSTVITLTPLNQPVTADLVLLRKVVQAAFKQRRKLLVNNLVPQIMPTASVARELLSELSLAHNIRAEELSIDHFLKLTDCLSARRMIADN